MMRMNKRAMKASRSLLVAEAHEYENDLNGTKEFKDVLEASGAFLFRKSEWLRSVYAFNTGVSRLSRVIGVSLTAHSLPAKGAK